MSVMPAIRYEGISPKAWEHPADRAATAALKAIPLMDQLLKRLSDMGTERRLRQILLGNAIKIGDEQLPDFWNAYRHCFAVLDWDKIPDLYITQTPFVNASVVGSSKPMVILLSGLAKDFESLEVQAVLAHETGHVLSEHYYYTTALVLITMVVTNVLPSSLLIGLPVRALWYALLEWHRMAELSSDRAAALVLGDPMPVCSSLMRMAGGAIDGMSVDAFVKQAIEYENVDDVWSSWRRFRIEIGQTHPFAVRRVRQLIAWVTSGEFDRIKAGQYVHRGQEPPMTEEFAAATDHYADRFTNLMGKATDGVQKVGDQISGWLRRNRSAGEGEDGDEAAGDD